MGVLDGGKGQWLAVEEDVPAHLVGLRHGGKVGHPKEYRYEKKPVHCAQCQKALPRFGRKGINILYIYGVSHPIIKLDYTCLNVVNGKGRFFAQRACQCNVRSRESRRDAFSRLRKREKC